MFRRIVPSAALILLGTVATSPVGARAAQVGGSSMLSPGAQAVPHALHGTLVLRGTMTSKATITMTGAFSVGQAMNLTWDLGRPESISGGGYSQTVKSVSYSFSVSPSSYEDLTVAGNPIRRFHWTNPPANTAIGVTESLHLVTRSDLTPFQSPASFPIGNVPYSVQPYLQTTAMLTLPATAGRLVWKLSHGKSSEGKVVAAVANWVSTHTHYSAARANGPYSATWVFSNHEANCIGYANLMAGLLRKLNIPAQAEYGWVSAAPLRLPGLKGRSSTIQWSLPGTQGENHVWLNVYFPGTGWVAFDPQTEKFFVDPRHFGFMTSVDAQPPKVGAWTAQTESASRATGRPLANGSVEIVPGSSAASKVVVSSVDTMKVSVHALTHDVSNLLLFSR